MKDVLTEKEWRKFFQTYRDEKTTVCERTVQDAVLDMGAVVAAAGREGWRVRFTERDASVDEMEDGDPDKSERTRIVFEVLSEAPAN